MVRRDPKVDQRYRLLGEASGRFGKYVAAAIERNNLDTKHDVAPAADMTYEHLRKLIKSQALPSTYAIQCLAKALKGFDIKEATRLMTEDHAERKYKKVLPELTGVPEDARDILKSWPHLTPAHKQTVLTMISAFEQTDRHTKR